MRKEIITLDSIKKDLIKIVNYQLSNKADWRFSYIVPITLLAISIGVLLKKIFIGVLVFSLAAYHIVRYILVIYEPHLVGRRSNTIKTITLYHFDGGSSWRLPPFDKHYEWSRDFYISPKGLENISIKGDEFYFVSLQAHHDIAYIYPCKNFELDKSLEK